MTGAAEQYHTSCATSHALQFGIDLINQIKMEIQTVDPEFREEIRGLIQRGVELEYRYAEDTMPRGVLA